MPLTDRRVFNSFFLLKPKLKPAPLFQIPPSGATVCTALCAMAAKGSAANAVSETIARLAVKREVKRAANRDWGRATRATSKAFIRRL